MSIKRILAATVMALSFGWAAAAVNINTATAEELQALPGIGKAKAEAIVAYRTENGPFKTVEDIKKVKGIGDKVFEKMKPELTIAGNAPNPNKPAKPAAK